MESKNQFYCENDIPMMECNKVNCLKVCQLNMLAPMWVNKEYKILPCYQNFASPKRLKITLRYIANLNADIYCLCEVEQEQLSDIALSFPGYICVFTSHKRGFWSEWLEDRAWVENGTCILLKTPFSEADSIDFGDGCRCTIIKCTHDLPLTIISVHFDTGDRKYAETEKLLKYIDTISGTCIISGDFNYTNINKFIDAGYSDGNLKGIDTTPLPQGMIDHTLVKGASSIREHILRIPNRNAYTINEVVKDICKTVIKNGSDHYATVSIIHL